MRTTIIALAGGIIICGCQRKPAFEYFGQAPPGNQAEIFAPGIISLDDRNESMITFSPDGKECFFTEHSKEWNRCSIFQSVYGETGWSTPARASFSNDYSMCPSITADGKQLFLAVGDENGMNVHRCIRNEDGSWSDPVLIENEINSDSYEFSCHPSTLGNIFVCSWREGGIGGCDGWRIPYRSGDSQKAENLGRLNSVVGDCVWAPGPDEAYLIFQSRRPPTGNEGGFFETDLFITFSLPDGTWSQPQNLGPGINSPATDGSAWVSHDGKYLFFSSDRRGTFDIYWVRLDSILRNTPKIPLGATDQDAVGYQFYQLSKDKKEGMVTMHFEVTRPGRIRLTVCDRAHVEIETILDEIRKEGEYNFSWNGRGYDKGEYLCRLEINDLVTGSVVYESTVQILLE